MPEVYYHTYSVPGRQNGKSFTMNQQYLILLLSKHNITPDDAMLYLKEYIKDQQELFND